MNKDFQWSDLVITINSTTGGTGASAKFIFIELNSLWSYVQRGNSVEITNPGTGYTSTNQPFVVFDDPLSYSNIALEYSSSSLTGSGTQAKANIIVGQGSSVIGFEITVTVLFFIHLINSN